MKPTIHLWIQNTRVWIKRCIVSDTSILHGIWNNDHWGSLTSFTYPNVCIRSREFHLLPRVDPRSIYASFLQDVTAKMPTACGQSLSFKPKVKYAKPGLSAVSEVWKLEFYSIMLRLCMTWPAALISGYLVKLFGKMRKSTSHMIFVFPEYKSAKSKFQNAEGQLLHQGSIRPTEYLWH